MHHQPKARHLQTTSIHTHEEILNNQLRRSSELTDDSSGRLHAGCPCLYVRMPLYELQGEPYMQMYMCAALHLIPWRRMQANEGCNAFAIAAVQLRALSVSYRQPRRTQYALVGRRSTTTRHFWGSPGGVFLGTRCTRHTCERSPCGAHSHAPVLKQRATSFSRKVDCCSVRSPGLASDTP